MKAALLVLALLVVLAHAQITSPTFPWPDSAQLQGLPQIYSAGYVISCGSAGLAGGCSSCVLGTNGACDWITITEPGLAENEPSCYPYGGTRGVCVPKGVAQYRAFVLDYYYTASEAIPQNFYFPSTCALKKRSFQGGAGFDSKSVIEVKNARCPADYKKEPAYRGYGVTTADSDKKTQVYRPEYCAFPKSEWPIDRCASSSL